MSHETKPVTVGGIFVGFLVFSRRQRGVFLSTVYLTYKLPFPDFRRSLDTCILYDLSL